MADRQIPYGVRSANPRFYQPLPPSSHLDVEVESVRAMPEPEYVIEQRIGDGDWQQKCRYGGDVVWAVERVRWWNALLRGRRSYRVVAVLGSSRSVVFGEGMHHV
ncbi:hypothetical protein [Stenotrophomonas humi]|uniref:hypothetical protein n=1 Tax=Stenotrophomonas humi TaxID=405444 RepID=UPI00128F0C37|nr:hypothetical protein [Stenotrophomonas humi]